MKIPLFLSRASFSELIAEMMAEPKAPSVERKDAESPANVPVSWSRAVLIFCVWFWKSANFEFPRATRYASRAA